MENKIDINTSISAEVKSQIEKIVSRSKRKSDFSVLYTYKGVIFESDRILNVDALGIFIPYLDAGKYKRFVVYLFDEQQSLSVSVASAYAHNVLPEYRGERWMIMNSRQFKAIAKVLTRVNRVFYLLKCNKICGKYMHGKYVTDIKERHRGNGMKIRYTLNVVE